MNSTDRAKKQGLAHQGPSALPKLLCVAAGLFLLLILCISYLEGMPLSNLLCTNIAVLCGGVTILYCLRDITNRFALLCFNVNYLLFLVGGVWTTQLRQGYLPGYLNGDVTATAHTCHVLAISLLIVDLAFALMHRSPTVVPSLPKVKVPEQKEAVLAPAMHTIILLMLVVTLLGKLVGAFIQYRFTAASSYIDSYTTSFNKPIYVWLPESIFYFSLCLWMATNPKKQLLFLMLIPVALVEGIILLSGDRGEPMCAGLMILYYLYRRSKREEGFLHLKRWHGVVAVLLIPVLIMGLQAVKYTRVHKEVSLSPELLMEFVEDQGVSAGVIAKAYTSREIITQTGGSSYVFGSLRNYLKQNMVSRLLTGSSAVGSNTVAMATSGDSLGSTIAYLWFRDSFLAGKGCGSSYIAEFYHDGGLAYMMLGSVFVAWLLIVLVREMKQENRHPFRVAFVLLAFKDLIVVSRTSTFTWLTNTFTVQNLLVLGVLLAVNQCILMNTKRGQRYEGRNRNHPYVG